MTAARTTARSVTSRTRSVRGFTLIEVLVVVAIIALLISILLPSLEGARRQARIVACGANFGTLGKATMFYAQSSKDELPAGWGYQSDKVTVNPALIGLNPWEFLWKYAQKVSPRKGTAPFASTGWLMKIPSYTCPSDPVNHTTTQYAMQTPEGKRQVDFLLSYGANLNPLYAKLNDAKKGAGKLSQIKRTAELTSYYDAGDDGNGTIYGYDEGGVAYGYGWILNDCQAQGNNQCTFEVHHKIGNNFAFYDTHVNFYKVLSSGPQYGLPPSPSAFLRNWVGVNGPEVPNWAKDSRNHGFHRPVASWTQEKPPTH